MNWYLLLVTLILPLKSWSENVDNSIYKLDFSVHRGNSLKDRGVGRKAGLRKREFTMEIENKQTYYQVDLEIGSERNVNQVLVDTGSSDLWVISADVVCKTTTLNSRQDLNLPEFNGKHVNYGNRNKFEFNNNSSNKSNILKGTHHKPVNGQNSGGTCTSSGSFSTSQSNSFRRNSTAPSFSIQYADGSDASGIWGHDTVRVGNISVPNLSFAIANETSSDFGVFGIGLHSGEVTYSLNSGGNYIYENFPEKLKTDGYINKVAFSIYLGNINSDTGNILFGAVDHAKYSGELQTVRMVNSYLSWGYPEPPNIEVVLSSVSFNSSGKSTIVTDTGRNAILDTGSTLSYFTRGLLSSFASHLGAKATSFGYQVPCPSGLSNYVDFNFNGKVILVPYESLIINEGYTCFLGILESNSVLLGDNFLRHSYIVMDYEELEVSLAQARHTDEEEIDIISSTIPNATRAPGYSSTLNSGESTGTSISYETGDRYSDSRSKESSASLFYPKASFMGVLVSLVIFLYI